jgi:hypothetical protein
MCAQWDEIAPIAAIVVTLAATEAAVLVAGALRSRDYHRFENRNASIISDKFPLPNADLPALEIRRKSLSSALDEVYKAAGDAQTRYFNNVVRSAACLVLAFLCLAIGAFLAQRGAPPSAPSNAAAPELVLSWIETIAIIAVLLLYWRGRAASTPWIRKRTEAEFLRQFQILSVIFPSGFSIKPDDDLINHFLTEKTRISNDVLRGDLSEIAARVQRFWTARMNSIKAAALTDADVTPEGILLYVRKRAVRQLGWFMDSAQRLEHITKRRGLFLVGLYCLAAALALIKHILALCHGAPPPHLAAMLLIVTGLSAAMTAYYVNQNSRSLIHRYNTQRRFIEDWLRNFNDSMPFSTLNHHPMDAASKASARIEILRFEEIMIGELVDWISITTHDSIELAP